MQLEEDFLKDCELAVKRLFKNELLRAVATGEKFGAVPFLDDSFAVECESLFPQIQRIVCRALSARELFRMHVPWAPALPLSSADCEKMIRDKNSRIALAGYFARSWALANWSSAHPSFYRYARGATASKHTPERIRTDPALLKQFPPTPLKGLDRNLCWGVHYRLLETQQQLVRAEEVWRHSGMADDAKWAQGMLEKLRDFLDHPQSPK